MVGPFSEIGPEQPAQFLDPCDLIGVAVPEVPGDDLPVVGFILIIPEIIQEYLFISVQAHAAKIETVP